MAAIQHRNGTTGGGWTLDTLQEHTQIVDKLKDRLDTERDRRYSEVNIEREKALKIKEEADKAALGLAREIQSYKDEKANQLREQIQSERGSLASKDDLAGAIREIQTAMAPLTAYVSGMGGEARRSQVDVLDARDSRDAAVARRSSFIATIVAVFSVVYAVVATIGILAVLLRH
jgi:hypothetical protein